MGGGLHCYHHHGHLVVAVVVVVAAVFCDGVGGEREGRGKAGRGC